MSDIFYYSNHCRHSQKVVEFISKNNMIEKISCICVDNRTLDRQNNNIMITLENGLKEPMPPSINSVPALLRKKHGHTIVIGSDAIIESFKENSQYTNNQITQSGILQTNVEPISYDFGSNTDISSEKFSDYGNPNPNMKQNYAGVDSFIPINAPEETYKADKLDSGVTVDKLMQMRNNDIPHNVFPIGGI